MVTQAEALIRLNAERSYEDELVTMLAEYFISALHEIPDITQDERHRLRDYLLTIRQDSMMHSFKFNTLVQMVFDSDKNNF